MIILTSQLVLLNVEDSYELIAVSFAKELIDTAYGILQDPLAIVPVSEISEHALNIHKLIDLHNESQQKLRTPKLTLNSVYALIVFVLEIYHLWKVLQDIKMFRYYLLAVRYLFPSKYSVSS